MLQQRLRHARWQAGNWRWCTFMLLSGCRTIHSVVSAVSFWGSHCNACAHSRARAHTHKHTRPPCAPTLAPPPPSACPYSYICYLYFQLYTHVDMFADGSGSGSGSADAERGITGAIPEGSEEGEEGHYEGEHPKDTEEPMLTVFTSVVLLTAITVTVAVSSE